MQDRLGELKEQLKRAVRPDSQLRVFYCGTYPEAPLPGLLEGPVDVGLIFTCTRGTVDLHEGGICGAVLFIALSPCPGPLRCGGEGTNDLSVCTVHATWMWGYLALP